MSDTKYHQALSANRKLVAEIDRLKAENERLRKAGDAMYNAAVQDSMGLWVMPAFEKWSEIKKEKESK